MKWGEPRWRQQRLRPDQGGSFAAPIGEKLPECFSDLIARICRDHAHLLDSLEGRVVDEAFFVMLREMGVVVDEGTVEHWRRLRAPKQWVREDCGAGHRPSFATFICDRCGAYLR